MRNTRLLPFIAAAALLSAGSSQAADSLLQPGKGDGKSFTIYWLHSLPDGTTVVEEAPVVLVDRPSRSGDQKILFDGALGNVSVRWHPYGNLPPADAAPNHEKGARLQLVVHGEFVVEVSNGKKVHVKPGNFLLQEDSTGFGHKMHCDAPKDGLGCVQVTMDAVDPAVFFKGVVKN
jgi:hypothetical protein